MKKLETARHVLREHGARGLAAHTRGFVRVRMGLPAIPHRQVRADAAPTERPGGFRFPSHLLGSVHPDEVLAADWTRGRRRSTREATGSPYTVNWVIPPAGPGSGGHQNIFRFVAHLERRGHRCHIYVYDPYGTRSQSTHERVIRENFEHMDAPVDVLSGPMGDADAVFATSWQTAYPVFNDPGTARPFYFVQDFEPLFYPTGSESILAENTYRFGFHGITAGRWLSDRLSSEYGMRCDHYEFGADADRYFVTNTDRNAVLFYARPPTPRRAWELGVLTLTLFAKACPDVEIHMAGWPLRGFHAGFPFVDHGALELDQLNELYNRMTASLVLSLTNCSLLPLELLSAGCVPVMNEAPNNTKVADVPAIRYCQPSPHALARELAELVRATDADSIRAASASVQGADWDNSCRHVESVMVEALNG